MNRVGRSQLIDALTQRTKTQRVWLKAFGSVIPADLNKAMMIY